MAKRRAYKLKIGRLATEGFDATPRDAAREAARHARKLIDQHDIRDREVKLYEGEKLVMSCSPSIFGRYRGSNIDRRAARHTIANCELAPSFKRQLRSRKRR